MRTPAELSRALNDAFNHRDVGRVRALFADDIDYRTPDLQVATAQAVIERYQEAWQRLPDAHGEVVRLIEDGDTVVFMVSVQNGEDRVSDNIAIHEWRDGKLQRYHLWRNPPLMYSD